MTTFSPFLSSTESAPQIQSQIDELEEEELNTNNAQSRVQLQEEIQQLQAQLNQVKSASQQPSVSGRESAQPWSAQSAGLGCDSVGSNLNAQA
jgi:hypothetical protein